MKKIIIFLAVLLLVVSVNAATHRVIILGWSTHSNNSDVFPEPSSIKFTNDIAPHLVWIFNDTATRDSLSFKFTIPQNYVGTGQFVIAWTSTATSGDVEWDIDYRAVGGNDTESMDQATFQEQLTANNDTAPSAALERMIFTITATDGNFAAGDIVMGQLYRDGTDAGDTIAAAIILLELYFEYNDV